MPSPLTLTYQRQLATLRASTSTSVVRDWSALGSYNDRDVERFLAKVLPHVDAGQRQAVRLTNSYMTRFTKRPRPLALELEELTGSAVRNGAALDEVYRRPFVTVWTALGKGVPYLDAVAAGLARVGSSAEMDVALSSRAASVAYAALDDRITGFQRVPDGAACEFCLLVGGQRYRTDDLMPLHNRCGCTVEPLLTGDRDRFTGRRDNDLDRSKGDVAVAVEQHGELGPVLTNAHQRFTGPDDI